MTGPGYEGSGRTLGSVRAEPLVDRVQPFGAVAVVGPLGPVDRVGGLLREHRQRGLVRLGVLARLRAELRVVAVVPERRLGALPPERRLGPLQPGHARGA